MDLKFNLLEQKELVPPGKILELTVPFHNLPIEKNHSLTEVANELKLWAIKNGFQCEIKPNEHVIVFHYDNTDSSVFFEEVTPLDLDAIRKLPIPPHRN